MYSWKSVNIKTAVFNGINIDTVCWLDFFMSTLKRYL